MNPRESSFTQRFVNSQVNKLSLEAAVATNNFLKKTIDGFNNLVNFLGSEERPFGKKVNWYFHEIKASNIFDALANSEQYNKLLGRHFHHIKVRDYHSQIEFTVSIS